MNGPRIGDLRHRLRIEAAVRTPDGGGGALITWSLVAEVSASVRPLSGFEMQSEDKIGGRVSHEIWLRYRPDVKPGQRFLADGTVFDVRAVLDEDRRRQWLRCLAEERVP